MILDLVNAELARITCGPSLPFTIFLGAELPAEGLFEIRCSMPVRDRDGKYERTLDRLHNVRVDDAERAHRLGRLDRFLAREVRYLLRDALCHEVDENLRLDGVLVFNPHPGAAR